MEPLPTSTASRASRVDIESQPLAIEGGSSDYHSILVIAEGGAVFMSMGPYDIPIQIGARIAAAHPVRVAQSIDLEIGAALAFTPIPFEHGSLKSNVVDLDVLASLGLSLEIAEALRIRFVSGMGPMMLMGGERENPFAKDVTPKKTLTLLSARGAASLEIALTDTALISLTPLSITWAPKSSALRDNINGVRRIEAGVGFGFRL